MDALNDFLDTDPAQLDETRHAVSDAVHSIAMIKQSLEDG